MQPTAVGNLDADKFWLYNNLLEVPTLAAGVLVHQKFGMGLGPACLAGVHQDSGFRV